GLKTHTKTCLIVRDEPDGIRRYCHIGTGNYNSRTARIYEDVGLLSSDPALGADLSDLFNYLTGYSRLVPYRKLLVAPIPLRDDREFYIGSADLMPRNLDRRVEAVAPVENAELQARLQEVLDINLADDMLAWELGPDGAWRKVKGDDNVATHESLQRRATERA